jgi:hypothetical protein
MAALQGGNESFVGLQQKAGGVVHVVGHYVDDYSHSSGVRGIDEAAQRRPRAEGRVHVALAAGAVSPAYNRSLTCIHSATDVEGHWHELKDIGASGCDVRQTSTQRVEVGAVGRGAAHVRLVDDGSRGVDRDVIGSWGASACSDAGPSAVG